MLKPGDRFRRMLPLLALSLVMVSACGSDADAEQSDSEASSGPSDAAIEAYFTAVASYDPDLLAAARDSTEPGSNADHYAGYLADFATAAIEGGSPIEAEELEEVEGGYTACGGTGPSSSCVTWADLEFEDGALVDFTVNGQSLDDRLVVGDGTTAAAEELATVEFLYAYQSPQSGTQFVVVSIAAGDAPVVFDGDRATYRAPDGSDYTSAGAWGADAVDPGDTSTVALPFENAPGGGTVSLPLFPGAQLPPVVVEIDTSP